MNVILERLEELLVGPDSAELSTDILDFRGGMKMTLQQLFGAIMVLGSPGSGKSTLLRTFQQAMLHYQFGGLILSVKGNQIAEAKEACHATDRTRDLIIFSPGGGQVFNPIEGETDINNATALIVELSDVLSNKNKSGSTDSEAFWRAQLEMAIKNLLTLCIEIQGKMDLLWVADLFADRAATPNQLADPNWQRNSRLYQALEKAKASPRPDPNLRLAIDYFEREFPAMDSRLQSSVSGTIQGVMDTLRRPPLHEMLSGKSTFTMQDLLQRGKICVCGMPALDSVNGRFLNAILQFCFCRAATREFREDFAFLVADEAQETVTRELMRFLAVSREFRICTVLATQNIALLDDRIGRESREALGALLGTKIFTRQAHAETCEWAANQIGKRRQYVRSHSDSRNVGKQSSRNMGESYQEKWDFAVQPVEFSRLRVGESICVANGQYWRCRWHQNHPGRWGTVKINR